MSLCLPVGEVNAALNDQSILLIDIRREEKYNECHIPGSINIPLFAIKTKSFLKDRRIVLADEGYDYGGMEGACLRLREEGFQAWYLNGGLYAWDRHGGKLVGDFFVRKQWNKVPAAVFLREIHYANWMIVEIYPEEGARNEPVFEGALVILYEKQELLKKKLTKVLTKYKDNPNASLLVCDQSGEQARFVEQIVAEQGYHNVYSLQGGIQEYKRYERMLAAMKEGTRTTTSVKKCPGCD